MHNTFITTAHFSTLCQFVEHIQYPPSVTMGTPRARANNMRKLRLIKVNKVVAELEEMCGKGGKAGHVRE